MIGQTLGHYKILDKLGAGGMGEVYRAEDTTLGREVAIKVLPEAFTSDPERLARFEREAKLLATLNHPHIAQIHALEDVDGQKLLVMELVEGETLAESVSNGAVPLEEALPLALQITQALEAAHERGIVHRDLKPANAKVTPEGVVKVLDFGLAKPISDAASGDLSHSPTLTYSPTQAGVLLGTAAYMSPEQARGQEVDRRTDIWSFGVVLWEMLTGRQLFDGETVSDILAGVLKEEFPWERLPVDLPRSIRRVLHRCLTRDLKERLHDIADARLEIEEAIAFPQRTAVPQLEPTEPQTLWNRLRTSWWALAAAVIIGALLASLVWRSRPEQEQTHRVSGRWSVTVPLGVGPSSALRPVLAASPDGQWLVFVLEDGGKSQLFQRSTDRFEVTLIPGTESAASPFFSPDSQWVGYWDLSERKLEKIPVAGGTPVSLVEATNLYGASWGPGDTIVYVPSTMEGIWRISGAGGEPELLLRPSIEHGAWDFGDPELLPDGSAVLFTGWRGLTAASAFVGMLDLDSRETTILIDPGSVARYVPSGHLVYHRANRLEAVPFSLQHREITGPAAQIPEAIHQDSSAGRSQFTFSEDGSFFYLPEGSKKEAQLISVDLEGREAPLLDAFRSYMYPRYSPSGSKLAVTVYGREGADLWVVDLRTGIETRLTTGGGVCNSLWDGDRDRLLFAREANDPPLSVGLFSQKADGSASQEVLLAPGEPGEMLWPYALSREGDLLVYGKGNPFTMTFREELWLLELESGETRPLLAAEGVYLMGAAVSPDDRWFAYTSDASGQNEVYVQRFPQGGERHQISDNGGLAPIWSPDGLDLYYVEGTGNNRQLSVVGISTTKGFRAGSPETLFGLPSSGILFYQNHPTYDLSPDGQSFVTLKAVDSAAPAREIRVVQNWFQELEHLAPTSGN